MSNTLTDSNQYIILKVRVFKLRLQFCNKNLTEKLSRGTVQWLSKSLSQVFFAELELELKNPYFSITSMKVGSKKLAVNEVSTVSTALITAPAAIITDH